MMRAGMQVAAIFQEHDGIIGPANLACAFDDGLENRPDIGRGGRDHAKDVAASGLVSQRLLQLAGLCLDLIEQPHILDRDHGLVGKGRNQFDLFVGERFDRLAAKKENADRLFSAQKGNAE
jgi:hypothetical protein